MERENVNSQQTSDDGQEFRLVSPMALEAIERAEVESAIATAKKFPRDIAGSLKRCKELALRTPRIAESCNYAVKRGGKVLVGPSIHFARIVAWSWGNHTALSRVVGCDRDDSHFQAVSHDLETNNRIGIEMDWPVQAPHVPLNATPEEAKARWKDMMMLSKRAGAAVALRVAIFQNIPLVLFSDIAEQAKLVAVGEGESFNRAKNVVLESFKVQGVSQEQIYRYLDIGGSASLNTDHIVLLQAILQAIVDGTMSAVEVFGPATEGFTKARAPETKQAKTEAKAPPKETKPAEPEKPQDLPEIGSIEPQKPADGQAADEAFVQTPVKEEKKKKTVKKEQKPAEPEDLETADLLNQVRTLAKEKNVEESFIVNGLRATQCMTGNQVALEDCNPRYLATLIKNWDSTVTLFTNVLSRDA